MEYGRAQSRGLGEYDPNDSYRNSIEGRPRDQANFYQSPKRIGLAQKFSGMSHHDLSPMNPGG